ncbi:unnamed protein product [Phytophthora lilii]|uniref:RxLR effector protein n=1 Tax=Phytophthora lilii TaxID=2077276 RepID=A0A9W6WTG7_9STRA|nr:unnamed protein product [Phytophthora lilii]
MNLNDNLGDDTFNDLDDEEEFDDDDDDHFVVTQIKQREVGIRKLYITITLSAMLVSWRSLKQNSKSTELWFGYIDDYYICETEVQVYYSRPSFQHRSHQSVDVISTTPATEPPECTVRSPTAESVSHPISIDSGVLSHERRHLLLMSYSLSNLLSNTQCSRTQENRRANTRMRLHLIVKLAAVAHLASLATTSASDNANVITSDLETGAHDLATYGSIVLPKRMLRTLDEEEEDRTNLVSSLATKFKDSRQISAFGKARSTIG